METVRVRLGLLGFILLAATAGFWINACANSQKAVAQPKDNAIEDPILKQISSLEFADFIDPTTAPPTPIPFIPSYDDLPSIDSLSQGERQLLFGWYTRNGDWVTLGQTFRQVKAFYNEFGEMPRSGADLVKWSYFRDDPVRMREFSNKSAAEQLDEIAYAINPVTGRVFESFDKDKWTAGGIYLSKLEGNDRIASAFGDKPGADLIDSERYKETWLLRVFGETAGKVVAEKPLVVLRSNNKKPVKAE